MKFILGKPIKHKGEYLKEIDIPLDELSGSDLLAVEADMQRAAEIAIMIDYSKVYLLRVAARAAKIPFEVMKGLSARDFTLLTTKVSGFLMGSGSEEGEEEARVTTQEISQEI